MIKLSATNSCGICGANKKGAYRSVSVLALVASAALFAGGAKAQPSDDSQATNSANSVEQVQVTSTRIERDGYSAPTPTTVIGADELGKSAENMVFDTIVELPSLAGSQSSETYGISQSGATGGVSTLNLRGLGGNRTLTLFDGERVVPALTTGVTDVAAFPQALIKRVDVVTGGASASWGSDAVAGVVNFIVDHDFTGLKGNFSGGVTTYGDDLNATASLTYGTSFFRDKAHFEISGEYNNNAGVPAGIGSRKWYDGTRILEQSIAGTAPGTPEYIVAPHVVDFQLAPGGIITAGPLKGIAFGPGGSPFNYQYGSPQASPYMAGGDQSSDVGNNSNLDSSLTRGTIYARLSYDITPQINVFTTFNWGAVHTTAQSYPGVYKTANLTIQCSNAYLPSQVAAACASNGISSFQFGTWDSDLPNTVGVNERDQRRFVVGANGTFNLLGSDWRFDTYATHGMTDESSKIRNDTLNSLYNLAIDAVSAPNGAVICRSTLTNPNNGCVPLDVIGTGVASKQAIHFITGTPYLSTYLRQDALSFSVNGAPLSDWAGPISIAAGFEYREEGVHQASDPYSQGNGGNPLLSSVPATNWFTGNFLPSTGNYHVSEGFVETVVPLLKDDTWGVADLDLAGRAEGYSTAGYVNTWKVGLTYAPGFVDGIRIRALQSRDVRAPNLAELFQAPQTFTQTVVNDFPPTAGQTFTLAVPTVGNPALKPEKGQTSEVGVVLQPDFLPGFSTSVDYYRIALKGAIGTISNQQTMDLCFQGDQALCQLIQFNSAQQPIKLTHLPINLASTVTDGVDFESTYRTDLQSYVDDMAGGVTIRSLLSHVSKYLTNPGIPNAPLSEIAGQNGGQVALWRWYGTESYDTDAYDVTFTERYVSPGVISTAYVQCTTNCPVPTINNPTINNNHIAGAFYFDIGASYNLTDKSSALQTQVYAKIDNVANVDPPVTPFGGSLAFISRSTNPLLYDVLGRTYKVGVRFSAD